jgi:hypothetical protein
MSLSSFRGHFLADYILLSIALKNAIAFPRIFAGTVYESEQSFRTMRWGHAVRINAGEFRVGFSKSLTSRRCLPSRVKVRSIIQLREMTSHPCV